MWDAAARRATHAIPEPQRVAPRLRELWAACLSSPPSARDRAGDRVPPVAVAPVGAGKRCPTEPLGTLRDRRGRLRSARFRVRGRSGASPDTGCGALSRRAAAAAGSAVLRSQGLRGNAVWRRALRRAVSPVLWPWVLALSAGGAWFLRRQAFGGPWSSPGMARRHPQAVGRPAVLRPSP